MRKPTILPAAVIILCALTAQSVAATNGLQTFRLLAKTESTLWIAEDISGEYLHSQLLTIALDSQPPALGKTSLKQYQDWSPITSALDSVRSSKPITLYHSENNQYTSIQPPITITAPDPNETLLENFLTHIQQGGSNAISWYKSDPACSILLPCITPSNFKLIYYYPAGLYINYHIDKAFYFKSSKTLLIFTKNPTLAVGSDSMHGFLILKEQEPEN